MKVKIKCPRCDSERIEIVAEERNPVPMYRCRNCGYKNNLFPQFGNKQSEESDSDEE